jgi:hypothetical protein
VLKCHSFTVALKKILKVFFKMPRHLNPTQTARAIAKLGENVSLAAVARELHFSKTCICDMFKEALATKQAVRTPMNTVI